MSDELRLIGFLLLAADQLGFVDPVFQNGIKRYVQRSRHDPEMVAGFDEISLAFAVEPRSDGAVSGRRIGERRLFAFRFPDHTVAFGNREDLSTILRQRLHEFHRDDGLLDNPLVMLDLLSFLGYDRALAQEMTRTTLWANVAANREATHAPVAAERIFQHGFAYAALSGKLVRPVDLGVLCLREGDLRLTLAAGLSRMKSGRLFPVLCLLLVTAAVLLVQPLQAWHQLPPDQIKLASEITAGLAGVWFLYEATTLSGRMSRRSLVDWLMRRFRQMMIRRG